LWDRHAPSDWSQSHCPDRAGEARWDDLMLLGHAWHGQCRPVALMLPAAQLSRCSACSGRLFHSTACLNAKRHPVLTDRLSVEKFSASYHTREKLLAWRLTPITFWSVSVSVP